MLFGGMGGMGAGAAFGPGGVRFRTAGMRRGGAPPFAQYAAGGGGAHAGAQGGGDPRLMQLMQLLPILLMLFFFALPLFGQGETRFSLERTNTHTRQRTTEPLSGYLHGGVPYYVPPDFELQYRYRDNIRRQLERSVEEEAERTWRSQCISGRGTSCLLLRKHFA